MADFDWVTARSLCSPAKVSETLKLQVKTDVDTRNKLRPERAIIFVTDGLQFSVSIEDKLNDSVMFELVDGVIRVLDKSHNKKIDATLTLNDDGECRLKVNGRELELWQFRKQVLEDLFFKF